MQYPCIEVSQLAPSTSFYAALFHPLQLRYLTAESAAAGHGFATFGSSLGPVLELRQVSNFAAVRLSSIRISAPSPTAIEAFCKQGIAANPESVFTAEEDFHQATMFDLDGNRIQVVCAETAHTPEVLTGNFTLILEPTKATHVSRVLDWNHYNPDSTKSTMARVSYALTASDESRPPGSSEQTLPKDTKPVEIKSPNEGGISAVFGALLGVAAGAAAGAAITYGVMAAKTPTAVPLRLESSRPRGLPTDSQRPVATSISTGLIEREPHKTPPLRTQYITFEEEKSSTRKSSSSRPAASVTERRAVPGHSNSTDRDIGKNSDTQVVRVSRDVEITGRKHRSKSSISNSMKSTQTSRRITLPSAENSDSMANEKAIEIQILEAEQKASVSDKSAQSPSSRNQVLTPKRIAEHKSSISSTSAKNHQRGKDLKPLNSGQGRSEDTISHQRSSGQNLGQNLSDGRLSMTQLPPVRGTSQASAPNFLLSPTGADAGECPDKVSHVSARKKDLPHSQVENSLTEDDHSHISARQFSFPPSEAGTSRLLDTVSHASKKVTRLRASHIKNGTVTHNSNVENTHSHVSARNSPLHSDTGNDTVRHIARRKNNSAVGHNEPSRSHISAQHFPLPPSDAGTDTISHNSRKANSTVNHNEHSRSHISARNFQLPHSDAGIDIISHISRRKNSSAVGYNEDVRSHISARHFPLPHSDAGTDTVSHFSEGKTSIAGDHDENAQTSLAAGHAKDTRCQSSVRNFSFTLSDAGTNTVSHISRKSTVQATSRNEDMRSHASARNFPLPPSDNGTDTLDHFSKRKASPPVGKVENSRIRDSHVGDIRSQVSAQQFPLPLSRTGTTEFFDTVSHVPKIKSNVSACQDGHSHFENIGSSVSARHVSLPASTAISGRQAGTSEFFDTVSHISKSTTELPASNIGNGRSEDTRSYISAQYIPLPASIVNIGSRAGVSESGDTASRVSARRMGFPVSQTESRSTEDKRSHVSARKIPLPASTVNGDPQAGASGFLGTPSHVYVRKTELHRQFENSCAEDKQSYVSARNIPLPASTVDYCQQTEISQSHISARNIPLPVSRIGPSSDYCTPSRISARDVPLPGSYVGSSGTRWDDDARSIAPSDSISNIGWK